MEKNEKNEKRSVRGIRIRSVNIIMILVSCVLYLLLITATIHVSRKYEDVHRSMDDYIEFEDSEALLSEGSAYLTEQVRLYVITLEPQYMENYFTEVHEIGRREQALERLKESDYGQEAYRYLEEALDNSNRLMSSEMYAMKLAATAGGKDMEAFPEEIQTMALQEEDLNLSQEEQQKKAQMLP